MQETPRRNSGYNPADDVTICLAGQGINSISILELQLSIRTKHCLIIFCILKHKLPIQHIIVHWSANIYLVRPTERIYGTRDDYKCGALPYN